MALNLGGERLRIHGMNRWGLDEIRREPIMWGWTSYLCACVYKDGDPTPLMFPIPITGKIANPMAVHGGAAILRAVFSLIEWACITKRDPAVLGYVITSASDSAHGKYVSGHEVCAFQAPMDAVLIGNRTHTSRELVRGLSTLSVSDHHTMYLIIEWNDKLSYLDVCMAGQASIDTDEHLYMYRYTNDRHSFHFPIGTTTGSWPHSSEASLHLKNMHLIDAHSLRYRNASLGTVARIMSRYDLLLKEVTARLHTLLQHEYDEYTESKNIACDMTCKLTASVQR